MCYERRSLCGVSPFLSVFFSITFARLPTRSTYPYVLHISRSISAMLYVSLFVCACAVCTLLSISIANEMWCCMLCSSANAAASSINGYAKRIMANVAVVSKSLQFLFATHYTHTSCISCSGTVGSSRSNSKSNAMSAEDALDHTHTHTKTHMNMDL